MKPETTLNAIRVHHPCAKGWAKLLAHLGKTKADDEPLPLLTILDSNGLDDALWCLRAIPEHDREWRLFAVWCARQVQHLMTDQRSISVLDVAERYARGEVSDGELAAAGDAAWDAARAAARVSAGDAAWDAARASARAAARDAARVSAGDAAWDAAWAAAWDAARDAARDAAWDAAEAAAQVAQAKELRRVCAAIAKATGETA